MCFPKHIFHNNTDYHRYLAAIAVVAASFNEVFKVQFQLRILPDATLEHSDLDHAVHLCVSCDYHS